MADPTFTNEGLSRRGGKLILSGVIAMAAIGYVVGLRAGVPEGNPGVAEAARAVTARPPSGDVHPAMSYADVGAGRLRARPNRETWSQMTAALRVPAAEPVVDVPTRERSLALRAERRAFNGAPPVIPHDAVGLTDRSCLACHGRALGIGGAVARDLPHPHMENCRQCHAAAAPGFLQARGGRLSTSTWQGVAAPHSGPRAMPGAPPAVPHTLQMRDSCLTCHGPHGWPGMQTTHPERRSCLQCHAPIEDRAHPGRTLDAPPFLPAPKVAPR